MPLVETFEQACEFKKVDPETAIPDLSGYPEDLREPAEAALKLFIVNDAINDSKPFDWDDYSQKKWWAWWDMENYNDGAGGFRFDDSLCDIDLSTVGSRLCFHSKEQLMHSVNTFPELWRKVIKG